MATLRTRAQNHSAFDYDDYDGEPSGRDKVLFALLEVMPYLGDTSRFASRYAGKAVLALAAVAIVALGADLVSGA